MIADDHAVVREGIIRIVEQSPDVRVVGQVGEGSALVPLVTSILVDVVVLDISMPGPGVFSLLKKLNSARPRLPVLVLSVHSEEVYASRLLKEGAAGYLTKDHSAEQLLTAIRTVWERGRYLSPRLAERLAMDHLTGAEGRPHECLSNREFQVFQLLSEGVRVADIAKRLWISPKTVSSHRAKILQKMRMSTNADLVRYTMQHDLESTVASPLGAQVQRI